MAPADGPRPTDKKSPTSTSSSSGSAKYISSSGHVLETPPLSARFTRTFDDIYNFLGLYIVSLLSLDPYTAAQNSQFNTRGRPNAYQDRTRWAGGVNRTGGGAAAGAAPRGGGGGGGGAGGSNGFGGGGPGRRIGTVEDVRAPECGSCG
ncbi:uncharacterized protein A1O9_06585 [Exophiala aquamarina CBS 119918]|uniref:Uncharacterized protein n=1 Tax=Exophiala aquamarina CBS 119918 TaxID=1182545 RepID=A0A072PEU8_9EURO|nr:uncharacterized protein A1O9_06585 [Exophiala aquamarina CBS 119918]KEF58659.1 hypothetical protein A1O9_06585 [Exophiala aquamarina CBS 119918]